MSSLLFSGDRLNTFIETKLIKHIKKDLRHYKLFTEMDMHAVIYYHLREAIGSREDWYVRCNFGVEGKRPDIVIFNRYNPKFVFELAFKISDIQNFPEDKLSKDREKLRKFKSLFPSTGKAYLIGIFDADKSYSYKLKEGREWEKHYYRELLINVQEMYDYKRWKEDWAIIKNNHKVR